MKIDCPNCGSTNTLDFRQDMICLLIRKFRKKTDVVLCMLIDENGFIIASDADKYVTKNLEHKIIALCNAMKYLAESGFNLIDCKNNIGRITYMEDDDTNINGFVMLIKSIIHGISIIAIIPSWLKMHEIIIHYEALISHLSQIFKQDKSQKFSQFLSNISDIKESVFHNEYDMY